MECEVKAGTNHSYLYPVSTGEPWKGFKQHIMGLIFILEFTLLMWHENWIKRGRCWRIVSLIPSSAQKAGIILIPFVPHSPHHLVYLLNLPISLLFSIFSPIILYKDIISGPKHWPPQLSCPIYCSPISSTHRRQTDPKNQILSIIV